MSNWFKALGITKAIEEVDSVLPEPIVVILALIVTIVSFRLIWKQTDDLCQGDTWLRTTLSVFLAAMFGLTTFIVLA